MSAPRCNPGNLKILLDGIAVNNAVTGSADSVLGMPVYQVERIEVIRGPGSALYGEFAFSGVVNIILSKNKQALHTKLAKDDTYQVDGLIGSTRGDLTWQANVTALETKGSGRQSNLDYFALTNLGNTPGEVYDHEKALYAMVNADYAGYHFTGQYINNERGDYFGSTGKAAENGTPRKEILFNLALSKSWQISPALSATASYNLQKTKLDHASILTKPAGAQIGPPPRPGGPPPVYLTSDNFRQDGTKDSYNKVDLQFQWQAHSDHKLLLGAEYAKFKVDDAYSLAYAEGEEPGPNKPEFHKVQDGVKRNLTSLVLQDEWRVSDSLDLTFGARYDDYSDWGSNTSPRIAAVWRLAEHHLLKAQYAEAFRPPTLQENNPGQPEDTAGIPPHIAERDTSLTSEKSETSEISYIYRHFNDTFRATAFNTRVSDLIEDYLEPPAKPVLRNLGKLNITGFELEWHKNFNPNLELFANYSYAKAKDEDDEDEKLTGSVEHLFNLGLSWNFSKQLASSVLYQYVGTQEGAEIPGGTEVNAASFAAYSQVDLSLVYKQAFSVKGLQLSATVKNVMDEEYSIQAFPAVWPQGLNQQGRRWSADITYEF